jgi:NAD(P)-dependent dehydrogenase (short-subunit alcohol dehydrogenase family)
VVSDAKWLWLQHNAAPTGRSALPYQVHVGRWDQLDGLVEAAYDRFGTVDVLVNNAGMSPLYDSLTSVTESVVRPHR